MTSDNGNSPKRLGVISDIHANLEALEATLAALDEAEVDRIVCCGDVVGYGASPNECIELLRERGIPTVMGNHDAAVLSEVEAENFNELARGAIEWTRSELTPQNIAWLSSLPMTLAMGEALIVHASPVDPPGWMYVLTYQEARSAFQSIQNAVCFLGHSHQPFFISLRGNDLVHLRQANIFLELGVRYLVNVGSVGQPRDRDARAACVIADFEKRTAKLLRVDYDIAAAQEKIRATGTHTDLAERLAHGH